MHAEIAQIIGLKLPVRVDNRRGVRLLDDRWTAWSDALLDDGLLVQSGILRPDWRERLRAVQAWSGSASRPVWLLVIAELDRREAWGAHWGCKSMAHWLSWQCSVSTKAAYEHVRVARALGAVPVITAAFERGELSYSKVRALTRIATPDSDAELCDLGRIATAAQLEKIIRGTVVDQSGAALPGVTVTEGRIKATDQLNGRIDRLNGVVESILPDWFEGQWTERPTSNPAAHFRAVLQGSSNKRPSKELPWSRCRSCLTAWGRSPRWLSSPKRSLVPPVRP